jgi:hypothetical protein
MCPAGQVAATGFKPASARLLPCAGSCALMSPAGFQRDATPYSQPRGTDVLGLDRAVPLYLLRFAVLQISRDRPLLLNGLDRGNLSIWRVKALFIEATKQRPGHRSAG